MKLNVFKHSAQKLRQITSMKNRWNWLYVVVFFKFCVKLRQWNINEIVCISSFCSQFASNFESNYIDENSMKLNVFHLFKSMKLNVFHRIVRSLRQMLCQFSSIFNRWKIDEIMCFLSFCSKFVSDNASDFIDRKWLKIINSISFSWL